MDTATKRKCSKCGQEKDLTEYHIDRSRPLGRCYVCLECYREYNRKRSNTPEELLRHKLYQQSERGKKRRRIRQQNDYWKNRHKYTVKKMVAAMIEAGEITRQPCEKCGEKQSVAHHFDYAKPLDITWLCHKHHMEVHRK